MNDQTQSPTPHIGVAYLTVTCASCHMVWRAYHVSPDHGAITHCMYCGTNDPTPYVEIDSEWDVIDVLARAYVTTPRAITRALTIWEDEVKEALATYTPPPTFHTFMKGTS